MSESKGLVRSILAGVTGVLAVIALTLATVGVWAKATVADGDKFAQIAEDVLDDPAVASVMAERLAERVIEAVGIDSLLDTLLVGPLQRLESTVEAAIRSAISTRLEKLLTSDTGQRIVGAAVERAHSAAVDLLRGDGLLDGVTVSDGQVSLNLLPLIGIGVSELQQLGLAQNLDVPDLSLDGDPDEQIAALSDALGRDLPSDFGQLVVYESDSVDSAQAAVQQAQGYVAFALRAVWILVIAAVLLTAASLLLARSRWRALIWLSLGVLVLMVALRSTVGRVVDEAPSLAAGPAGAAAISITVDELTAGLLRLSAIVALIAVVAVVVAGFRRGWPRSDVQLAVAVGVGVVTLALVGISILGLLIALAIGVGTVFVGRFAYPSG